MIVIRHRGGLATVYAHASRLLVHRGQKVRAGQRIALSGKSGRATGPHLHFELRSGAVAVDPRAYLPTPDRNVAAASATHLYVKQVAPQKKRRYVRHRHRKKHRKHRTFVASRESSDG